MDVVLNNTIAIYKAVIDAYTSDEAPIVVHAYTKIVERDKESSFKKLLFTDFLDKNKKTLNNAEIYVQLGKNIRVLENPNRDEIAYIQFTSIGMYENEALLEIFMYSPQEGFFRNDFVLLKKENQTWNITEKILHRMS